MSEPLGPEAGVQIQGQAGPSVYQSFTISAGFSWSHSPLGVLPSEAQISVVTCQGVVGTSCEERCFSAWEEVNEPSSCDFGA